MKSFVLHQSTAAAMGMGAASVVLLYNPLSHWTVVLAVFLSGFIGGNLPDIDCRRSASFKIIKTTSWIVALLIPFTQFVYRPTDLLLALLTSYLLMSSLWWLIDRFIEQNSQTHSLLSAVCLSMMVAFLAYLLTDSSVILPAFLTSCIAYILHLYLDDTESAESQPEKEVSGSSLVWIREGHYVQLTTVVSIGLISMLSIYLF